MTSAGDPSLSTLDQTRVSEIDALAGDARGIAALLERLSEPSWAVRRAVVAALARAGDPAVRGLCEVLRSHRDDEARLAAAVDALSAARGDVEGAVLALLSEGDSAVVCDAAQILGRRKSLGAVGPLAALLTHADDNVAVAAVEALGRIGGATVIEPLIGAARSGNFFRTFPAIDVLGRSGDPRAVAPLGALLSAPHYALEATRALGRLGVAAAVPLLAASIARANDATVRVAAAALAEVHDRQQERFAAGRATVAAIHAALAEDGAAAQRLAQSLDGADAAEQATVVRVLGWIGGETAAARLVELLDAAPLVARAAAAALGQLGPAAEPRLLLALETGGSARRLLLLPVIGRRAASLVPLLACLDDPDGAVRALACEALGRTGDVSVVDRLFARLADEDPSVVQAASAAVQSLGSERTSALALAAARSPLPAVRRAALRIVAYFGDPAALDVLIEGVDDDDARIRDVAIGGLPFVEHPRAVASLLAAAAHPSPKTRASAMRALGNASPGVENLTRLRLGLGDVDAWVRYYACQSLGKLRDEESAAAMIACLQDPAGQVRVAAIDSLSRLRAPEAAAALRRATGSPDPDVQRAALLGLAATKNVEALPIILLLAESADHGTRLVALSAMAELDAPEVVEALARAASDADDNVRAAAVGYLGARPGLASTRALVTLLQSPGGRDHVVQALSHALPGRLEGLLSALETAQGEVASLLVGVLARTGRADSHAAIGQVLGFENVHARRAAAAALTTLPSPDTRAILARAAHDDEDVEVRRLCSLALEHG